MLVQFYMRNELANNYRLICKFILFYLQDEENDSSMRLNVMCFLCSIFTPFSIELWIMLNQVECTLEKFVKMFILL